MRRSGLVCSPASNRRFPSNNDPFAAACLGTAGACLGKPIKLQGFCKEIDFHIAALGFKGKR
jgi:hypothetical protein